MLELDEFLENWVSQNANAIDTNPEILDLAFSQLKKFPIFIAKIASNQKEQPITELELQKYQQKISRYSGALAFLNTQHQSATNLIIKSENQSIIQRYIPLIIERKLALGIGFSHLRRKEQPVKATPTEQGYLINGIVPWITGYTFFQQFILASRLPSNEVLFSLIPLTNIPNNIHLSQPINLASMNSTLTVSATINNYLVPPEAIIQIQTPDWIEKTDHIGILNNLPLIKGCILAALDQLALIKDSTIQTIREIFQQELLSLQPPSNITYPKAQTIKIKAINLMQRTSIAVVTAYGGAANNYNHPAQRIYREAMIWSVSGQNQQIKHLTLTELANSGTNHMPKTESKQPQPIRDIELKQPANNML